MIGIIALAVFSLPLVVCLPLNATETTLQCQAEQQAISCLLQEDRETRAAFYTAVQAKHGFQDTPGIVLNEMYFCIFFMYIVYNSLCIVILNVSF